MRYRVVWREQLPNTDTTTETTLCEAATADDALFIRDACNAYFAYDWGSYSVVDSETGTDITRAGQAQEDP